jgi:hypothetical protein
MPRLVLPTQDLNLEEGDIHALKKTSRYEIVSLD